MKQNENLVCQNKVWRSTDLQKCDYATIMVIIFWDFLTFYQNFLSPQVKQSKIISNKHGIYNLPPELPNDLKLRISGN